MSLLEAQPDVGFVYGYARSFTGNPPIVDPSERNWSIWQGLDWIRIGATKKPFLIASPEVVMRREALVKTGGCDASIADSGVSRHVARTALDWSVGRVTGRFKRFIVSTIQICT